MEKIMFWITKNRKWFGWIGVPLVIFVMIWVGCSNNIELPNLWENLGNINYWWVEWGDPILGVSTFLVAIIIWLLEIAKDWEDRLPKLLTIIYKLNGREVIKCENATLAHESDIRNWGQTLGRQTVGKVDNRMINFDFKNKFDIEEPTIHKSDNEGTGKMRYYKHYKATFYLKSNSNFEKLDEGKFVWKAGDDTPCFISDKKNENNV